MSLICIKRDIRYSPSRVLWDCLVCIMQSTLHSQNIIHPTAVQMQTILKILKGCNILCAAETGSGKTLAYLLPIIHRLQEEPFTDSERNIRAVVIVPSRELAEQVTSVARSISRPFGLVVKVAGGGRGVGNIRAAFTHGQPDVLVATPGALLKALWKRFINLNELNFLVIDEAMLIQEENVFTRDGIRNSETQL
uniref:ATP-dependent RNA helicase n=1 Tax=Cyprinus carpio carpio TaxID=630221 RepID=A0A9J7YVS6_CYPCA